MRLNWRLFTFAIFSALCGDLIAGKTEFPTFGITIKVPWGWEQVPPTREGHVAQWARGGGEKQPKDVVALEIVPLTQDFSPLNYAKNLAKTFEGDINQEVKMGGLPAVEVRAQRKSNNMTPRQVRVAAHRGYLWILSFWSSGKGSYAMKTINTIANSIEFSPVSPPWDHLELDSRSNTILKGKFYVTLPQIARPIANDKPSQMTEFGITNFSRQAKEFIFKVQISDNSTSPNFSSSKEVFARFISKKFPGLSRLEWKELTVRDAQASILAPVIFQPQAGSSTIREFHYGILFHQQMLYVLSFAINTWESKAASKYKALIPQIIQSIQFPSNKRRD